MTKGAKGSCERRPFLGVLVLGFVLLGVCRDPQEPPPCAAEPAELFTDRAAESGLRFANFNGATGRFYIVEVTGSGCGMLDYDNDGDLDLFLTQGRVLEPGKSLEDAIYPAEGPLPLIDRLFRNDLAVHADGSRTLRFADVTAASGLHSDGYGMGVTSGDYDNDGWIDLYVTNFGRDALFANHGDGTFREVDLGPAGEDERWSVPAAFLDYDRDGWLDLFVGAYLDFSYARHKTCRSASGAVDYCGPNAYRGIPDRLLHNERNGGFRDVTMQAGLRTAFGPALGVVTADLNGDGWLDIYVANDEQPNQLWINRRQGTFVDDALLAGAAVSGEGMAESSMGVVAADFDADADEDLFMTHLTGQTNTFYRNDGSGLFEDASIQTGLGAPSNWATAFGTGAVDYDNDGWLDIVAVNGAVRTIEEQARRQIPYPLRQPNQLFRNLGGGQFEELTDKAGPAFLLSEVSRGAAFGDVDNDGDVDVLVLNNNGPARLLINNVGQDRAWLGLRLLGHRTDRDMLGSRAAAVRPGQPTLWRRVHTDGSFASASDSRVVFGLGSAGTLETVRVEWLGGGIQEWTLRGRHDRYIVVRESAAGK